MVPRWAQWQASSARRWWGWRRCTVRVQGQHNLQKQSQNEKWAVCVCVTGIGHIHVLGLSPLTLPAVQSEENLAADGIPGRLRLASAMPVCRAAVRRPDAATKVP